MENLAPPAALPVLRSALLRLVPGTVEILNVTEYPIRQGFSKGELRRFEVLYASGGQKQTIRLVTKDASLVERRTLLHLQAQGHAAIPFSHAVDLTSERALICLQDLGDTHRPSNRGPVPDWVLAEEARILAEIHVRNLGGRQALPWLPPVDRSVFARRVDRFWNVWEEMRSHPWLGDVLRRDPRDIERQAATAIDDMEELQAEGHVTLTHGDMNPENMLVCGGRLFLIDWQHAGYGSLFLDVPHHFPTLELAGYYHRALSAAGYNLSPAEFAHGYTVAARYTAIRYLWWMLFVWRETGQPPPETPFYAKLLPERDGRSAR